MRLTSVALVSLVLLFFCGFGFAATLVVNGTANCTSGSAYYPTIGAAVTAATAGDTILVCANGTAGYMESVTVNKALNIYGYGGKTLVNSSGMGNTFSLTANSINISNFTLVAGTNYGLYLSSSSGDVISNINATSSGSSGIYLDTGSNGNTLSNLNASGTTCSGVASGAIVLYSNSNNRLTNVIAGCSNSGVGVNVVGSNNNTFYNVTASSLSANAFYLRGSANNSISNSTALSTDRPAIRLELSSTTGNNITGTFVNSTSSFCLSSEASAENNWFLHNTLVGYVWVNDDGASNIYNDSTSGNTYYFTNGTGAWEVYNISDNNSDSWADKGSDLPFSNSTQPGSDGHWQGAGADWHPWAPTPTWLVVSAGARCTNGAAYYSNINAALDAASDGDIIAVCPGTYNENLYINKSVGIYGQGSGVVVNALNSSKNAIEIEADLVTIANITVEGATEDWAAAISVGSDNATVADCIINNSYRGIYLYHSNYNNFSNINITSNSSAVYTITSAFNIFSNVDASSYETAIYLMQYSDYNTFSDITAFSFWEQTIGISQGSHNAFTNLNASSDSSNAIGIRYQSYGNNLSNVYAAGNESFALYIQGDSSEVVLSDAVLVGGADIDDPLKPFQSNGDPCNNNFTNVSDGNGRPILFFGNQEGVELDGVDASQIIFCNVSSSSISNSNATAQDVDAVDFFHGTGNNVFSVEASTKEGYAIYLSNATGSTILNVNATAPENAFFIFDSVGNNITGLRAATEGGSALELTGSFENIISDSFLSGGLELYAEDESSCDNTFVNVTSGNGKPIYFYGNQEGVELNGIDASQIIFCNVSSSSISNSNATADNYGRAIQFWFASNSSIENVSASSNKSEALYLIYSSGISVSNAEIASSGSAGLRAAECPGLEISNATAEAYYDAIYISDSSGVSLIGSTAGSSMGSGIHAAYCSDGEISGNTLRADHGGCVFDDDSCQVAFKAEENSNLSFLNNTLYSDYWVGTNVDGTVFNDSTSGNRYYLFNGTPASEIFDITSSTGTWADGGSSRPFNLSNLAVFDSYCIQGAEEANCSGFLYSWNDDSDGWANQSAIEDLDWNTGSAPSEDGADYYGYYYTNGNTVGASVRVASNESNESYALPQDCLGEYSIYIHIYSNSTEPALTVYCTNQSSYEEIVLGEMGGSATLNEVSLNRTIDILRWFGGGEDWHPWVGSVTRPSHHHESANNPIELVLGENTTCPDNGLMVSASSNGTPVENVYIKLFQGDSMLTGAMTDSSGKAYFTLSMGASYDIEAEKSGYSAKGVAFDYVLCTAPEQNQTNQGNQSQANQSNSNNQSQGNQTNNQTLNQTGNQNQSNGTVQNNTGPTMDDALAALADANSAIVSASNAGKDVSAAQDLLNQARVAYDAGNYSAALDLSNQAKTLALNASTGTENQTESTSTSGSEGFSWWWLILLIVILGVGYFLYKRRKK